MKLYTYLNYGGNCRQAFDFYVEHLGAELTEITTFGELPKSGDIPEGWKKAVVHARIALGDTVLFGADVQPDRFKPMRSAYLTLMLDSDEEAERLYELLSKDGEIFMPMEETFFARRFAMLRDRFGTSWMLLHQVASQ